MATRIWLLRRGLGRRSGERLLVVSLTSKTSLDPQPGAAADTESTSEETAVAAQLRSVYVILVALGGGAVAAGIVFIGSWNWPDSNAKFSKDGAFLIWFFLIAVQAAAWPLALVVTADMFRRVKRVCPGGGWEVGLATGLFLAAAFAVVALGVFGPNLPQWLPNYRARILILSALGIAAALLPAVAILKIQVGLRTLLARSTPGRDDIRKVLELKEVLSTCLGLLGILLSLAIVGAAAERNAVDSYCSQLARSGEKFCGKLMREKGSFDIDRIFPLNYVTLYGLLLSILIAIAYAPAHISYNAIGRSFRNKLFPITAPEKGWQAEKDKRSAFEELLDLRSSTIANLKASILVLGPLLASLTGLLGK